MVGRYPDFDVLNAADGWDDVTKRVVMRRLEDPGPMRYFRAAEQPTLRAFCDCVTAQDMEPRIPVAEMVDAKLADGRLDGYRYEDMPEDGETWRLVLLGLDETARQRSGLEFSALNAPAQEEIVAALARGELTGSAWGRLNVARAWSVCMRAVLSEFYSHPWAWNEIGFGGPAYPRGFMRLGTGVGVHEPFETPGATDEDPARFVPKLEL
jgi:Gluconate 2-dehydrogenase subunit 3